MTEEMGLQTFPINSDNADMMFFCIVLHKQAPATGKARLTTVKTRTHWKKNDDEAEWKH